MPSRTSFLDKQRKQIAGRLEELRPMYEEYLTLLNAQDALDSVKAPRAGQNAARNNTARTPARGRKRGPGRPPGRPRGRPRRGRRSDGQTRADQALAVIAANPGVTVPEVAEKLGIRQNYLYRVMAQLQKERKVRRRNRGFHAV